MKVAYRFSIIFPIILLSILSLLFINLSITTIASLIIFYILIYQFAHNIVHRAIAHKQMTLTPLGERIVGFLFIFSLKSDPLSYALVHRYHHRYADTEKDYFSPTHGFFRCFFINFYNLDNSSLIKYQGLIKDYPVTKFKFFWFLYKHKPYIVWITLFLISTISIDVALGLILASSFIFFTEQFVMTFVEHSLFKKGPINVPIWAIFSLTDYHKNHHDHPWKTSDTDPGKFLMPLCKFLRLAK